MDALPAAFSAEQKLALWTKLRDLEGSAMLYSKVARYGHTQRLTRTAVASG
jgi:hypothetical protein